MSQEDDRLLERLRQLDDSFDVDVTSDEADFLENVCFRQSGALTSAQRKTARRMLKRYGF